MQTLVKKIVKASGITVASTVVYLGLIILTNSLIGRIYGPEGLGLFAAFLMFVQLYSMFAIFGLPVALSKYTAEHEEKKEHLEITKIFSSLLIFATFSSIIIGIISRFTTPSLARIMHIQSTNHLSFFISIALLFFSYSMLCQALFQGLLKAFKSALIQNLSFLGILLVILYAYFFKKIPIYYAIVCGYLASGLLGIWLCLKENVLKVRFSKKALFKIIRFAIPLAIGTYMFFIAQWADRFILGSFFGVKEIGLFTAAIVIIQGIQRLPISMANILVPSYSKFFLFSKEKAERAFNLNVKIFALFLFLMGTFIYLFAKDIIFTIYGENFESAILILQILSLNLFISCLNIPSSSLIIGCGFPKMITVISSIAVLLQISFIIFFTAHFGIIGTAIGRMLSLLPLLFLNLLVITKILKVKLRFKNLLTPIAICSLSSLIFLIFRHLIENRIILSIIFFLSYLILSWLLSFSRNEKKLIREILTLDNKS